MVAKAVPVDERFVEYFNRGVKYLNASRFDKALQFFKKSYVGLKSKEVYLNMGNALARLDRDSEAIEALTRAADPGTPFADGRTGHYDLACNNLGLMKYRVEDLDSAISYYKQAIQLGEIEQRKGVPFNGDPVWNYANAYLRKLSARQESDWGLGWGLYEYRFNRKSPTPINNTLRRWDKVSREHTIVVLSEQGMGDKVQFGRYLSHLRNFCDRVVVQVPAELNCFFEPEYITVAEDLTPYSDCAAVPFCDLAWCFGWNSSPAEWIDKTKFPPNDLGPQSIIVEWAGNRAHANDRNRSTTPEFFLQLKNRYPNLHSFRESCPRGLNPLGTVKNWSDTCRAILGSSIVVTVDTSVVHVCGSLGHPCIMIQPTKECDWRWGTAAMGRDNLWYPSVRIARNPNSWKRAFDEVHAMLEEHFANNQPS